jgi:hypothetical protein
MSFGIIFPVYLSISIMQSTTPKAQTNSRLRRICYTLNNYTDGEYQTLKNTLPNVQAHIIGREVGKDGTPHLQGAVLFSKQVYFSTLKKLVPRLHIERMVGTPMQAFEYCRKEGDYWECGSLPTPGKRTDLAATVKALKEGSSLEEIAQTEEGAISIVKHFKGFIYLQNLLLNSAPLRQKTVIWLYGPTGAGKTRAAVEFADKIGEPYWISGRDLSWFDGYCGQRIAILDDFRWRHLPFSFLLRVLDRYELQVPIKGGFVRWNPQFIFITTPKTILETFDHEFRDPEDLKQVQRRVSHVLQYPQDSESIIWPALTLRYNQSKVITPPSQEVCQSPTSSHHRNDDNSEDSDVLYTDLTNK